MRRLLDWDPATGRTRISTRQAARNAGINHVTISNALHGDRISAYSAEQIAKAFGVNVAYMQRLAGVLPPTELEAETIPGLRVLHRAGYTLATMTPGQWESYGILADAAAETWVHGESLERTPELQTVGARSISNPEIGSAF